MRAKEGRETKTETKDECSFKIRCRRNPGCLESLQFWGDLGIFK